MTKEQGEALIKYIDAAIAVPVLEMLEMKEGELRPVLRDYGAAVTARAAALQAFVALLP